jgi:hypothetical protein
MNHKILAVNGGFYFFGTEVASPEGYITLEKGAMFGGFEGGKGLPGVCRGDEAATVILDFFADDQKLVFPISAVFAIFDSIDLRTFKGTTIR